MKDPALQPLWDVMDKHWKGMNVEPDVGASSESVEPPASEAPVLDLPASEAPVVGPPASEAPVVELPASETPAEPPSSEAPVEPSTSARIRYRSL